MSIDVIKACNLSSRAVFDDKVAMINRHNLEADLGLHSYTVKINQFANMLTYGLFSLDHIPRRIIPKIESVSDSWLRSDI